MNAHELFFPRARLTYLLFFIISTMSTASTELAAGTVDITTAKPVATDGNEWSPFTAHEWHGGDSDTEKLRTLEKLCRTKVIRATYRSFKGQSGIRIRVYISTSKAHGYEAAKLLLRLMYWLDRRPELFDGTPTQLNASPVNPFTGEVQSILRKFRYQTRLLTRTEIGSNTGGHFS